MSEELLSLLAGAPIGLVRFDVHGLITSAVGGVILERRSRLPEDAPALVGQPVAAIWPDVEPLVARAILETLLGDAPALEIDDEGRELALLFSPERESGMPAGGICTVIDVSALRARRLMNTTAEEALIRFSAGLAPSLEAMALVLRDAIDEQEVALVQQDLAELARDLTTYGGRRTPRPSVVAVNRHIAEFANDAARTLPIDAMLVVQTVGGEVRLAMDPDDLDYVLGALVERSGGALDAGGTLTLRCAVRPPGESDVDAPFGMARIEILDTGGPLPTSLRHSLLWPFDGAAAANLRLAAARQIVTRAGGRISVNSTFDGSSLVIELPLLAEPLDRAPAPGRTHVMTTRPASIVT